MADAPETSGISGELDIKRFDPTTMKPHRIAVCIGKRGTGKSVLIRDLMYHMRRNLHYGVAMTPTHESAECFEKFMPLSSVYKDYRVDVLERMLNMQRQRSHDKGMDSLRSLFLILDDCMYDKSVMKGNSIRDLFMNGRHYKLFFLAAVQYLMDLTPALRTQVDYCFALRENIVSNRERLYKYFFGVFPKYDDFSRVFDACTADYECLVIDNTVQTNRISDCIFWYRADINIPPFRLCAPAFWTLDAARGQEKRRNSDGINVVDAPVRKRTEQVHRIVKHTGH